MRTKPVYRGLIALNTDSDRPLYRQLYTSLRHAILEGQLQPGQRLPATRTLAQELGVSRSTVVLAFDQLFAEGYLEGITGSGTYVVDTLPEDLLETRLCSTRKTLALEQRPGLSKRGETLSGIRLNSSLDPPVLRPFQSGVPALDEFPHGVWSRITARQARTRTQASMGYAHPAGYGPLREVIATYLRTSRAVRCEPDQVIIVNGAQQGLDLVTRVLLDPGDTAWIEDPGYLGTRGALRGADVKLAPVPVDDDGLQVDVGAKTAPQPKLIYVTPSHHYPTGVVMSLSRRLELLEWVSQRRTWILEDDYDSEYRYGCGPLASLQGLDGHQRVIYLGTFSKVLFPDLRLGYLVVPPDLVQAFSSARAVLDRHSSTFQQSVLAHFIEDGHLGRHIRRMRLLYQKRQQALVEFTRKHLDGLITVHPNQAGMHIVGWLPDGVNDAVVSRRAAEAGITAPPLSMYRLCHEGPPGLVLGYAAFKETRIEEAVLKLKEVLVRG